MAEKTKKTSPDIYLINCSAIRWFYKLRCVVVDVQNIECGQDIIWASALRENTEFINQSWLQITSSPSRIIVKQLHLIIIITVTTAKIVVIFIIIIIITSHKSPS